MLCTKPSATSRLAKAVAAKRRVRLPLKKVCAVPRNISRRRMWIVQSLLGAPRCLLHGCNERLSHHFAGRLLHTLKANTNAKRERELGCNPQIKLQARPVDKIKQCKKDTPVFVFLLGYCLFRYSGTMDIEPQADSEPRMATSQVLSKRLQEKSSEFGKYFY